MRGRPHVLFLLSTVATQKTRADRPVGGQGAAYGNRLSGPPVSLLPGLAKQGARASLSATIRTFDVEEQGWLLAQASSRRGVSLGPEEQGVIMALASAHLAAHLLTHGRAPGLTAGKLGVTPWS